MINLGSEYGSGFFVRQKVSRAHAVTAHSILKIRLKQGRASPVQYRQLTNLWLWRKITIAFAKKDADADGVKITVRSGVQIFCGGQSIVLFTFLTNLAATGALLKAGNIFFFSNYLFNCCYIHSFVTFVKAFKKILWCYWNIFQSRGNIFSFSNYSFNRCCCIHGLVTVYNLKKINSFCRYIIFCQNI